MRLLALSSTLFGLTPFAMTVYCGSIQNCLSKASKYSVFDASKELAFFRLARNPSLKEKQRSMVSVRALANRVLPDLSRIYHSSWQRGPFDPLYRRDSICCPLAWIFCVVSLGKQFKKMTTSNKSLLPPSLKKFPNPSGR